MPKDDNVKTASARSKSNILRWVPAIIVLALLAVFAWYRYDSRQSLANFEEIRCGGNTLPETTVITSGGQTLMAEVAITGAEKQQGLSGRECLDDGAAMLFPYDLPGDYCFWMKDMNFPIDMIWLDDEKKIVTVHGDVSPDTYPGSFCPDRPAQYIVEVRAGLAKRLGWRVGTEIDF